MFSSDIKSIVLFFLFALVHSEHNLDYSDLEAMGKACPSRAKCHKYINNLSYTDRNCECDSACSTYNDCCIDSPYRRFSGKPSSNETCLHYGEKQYSGVYVVSVCSSSWNGPIKVRQGCEGPANYSDPLSAAPATSVDDAVTYKNLFCAECNNANLSSLVNFQFRMGCDGLEDLPEQQIMGDLTYNQQQDSWGVTRMNSTGHSFFVGCRIIFDVPGYLNNSVRFCRADVISTCAPDWARHSVRKHCAEYMAVVYDNIVAYRNPHCAICNRRTVNEISCTNDLIYRRRPMSFALLLDVNQSDGDQVGMTRVATPQCPSGHKYDPFFKRCRQLVCALPGHMIVAGRCQPIG